MLTASDRDKANRRAIESGKITHLESIEAGLRKGTLKHIDSGFNHVLATLANKKGVRILINLDELRTLPLKEKADRLAKIRYNLQIGRKKNVHFVIKGTSKEASAFLLSLGASTQQAKNAKA